MTDHSEIRTAFILHPPVDDAASWHMTVDGFVHALTQSFPGAFTKLRTSRLRATDAVDFEVEIETGIWVEGNAQTPVPECGVITLAAATAVEAAKFAMWVRDGLIPAPGLLRFSTGQAMEAGRDEEWVLPAVGGADVVAQALLQHLERIG
ncbi:hypothetical protein [Streptomyces sp. NPDC020681]|uniref:hypothetical protein n=1 Tax=Streptomyces sp. NPDC020681 TaxID=3365083 RepID=UPI0037BACAA5